MINISVGRYWDEGITLVDGCTPCSPGCEHCWSAAISHRFDKRHSRIKTNYDKGGIETQEFHCTNIYGKFNGEIVINPERLKRFNTRKPKVFAIWNDLFHEDVPDDFITQVYIEASIHPDNTFLILTKRPDNMARVVSTFPRCPDNIYNGLTVCNQQEADEKIPIFLQVPGKKFLSIEPMLGKIDIGYFLHGCPEPDCGMTQMQSTTDNIHAVILGGETGPGARPLYPDWVRSVRDQCAAAGVPFFFKQWGEWLPDKKRIFRNAQSMIMGDTVINKVGRNKAGRKLDGRTHDDLPWGGKP